MTFKHPLIIALFSAFLGLMISFEGIVPYLFSGQNIGLLSGPWSQCYFIFFVGLPVPSVLSDSFGVPILFQSSGFVLLLYQSHDHCFT